MFTDIHGHYAWGIDDGIPSKEEAIKALEMAKDQKISTIVATPHITCGTTTSDDLKLIVHRIEEFKGLAEGYDIDVIKGCELMLNHHVDEALNKNIYLPIEDTSYILCEYNVRKPTEDFLDQFEDYIMNVKLAGYIPVVAHVERYFHEVIDLDYVQFLIDLGCVIQVNTTSILGTGHAVHHDNAIALLDAQMVHVVATDTHKTMGGRIPNMQTCFDALLKAGYQREYAELLLKKNPERLLKNEDIIQPEFKKRGFLTKLFR